MYFVKLSKQASNGGGTVCKKNSYNKNQHHFSIMYDRGRMEVINLMTLKMTRHKRLELFVFRFQKCNSQFQHILYLRMWRLSCAVRIENAICILALRRMLFHNVINRTRDGRLYSHQLFLRLILTMIVEFCLQTGQDVILVAQLLWPGQEVSQFCNNITRHKKVSYMVSVGFSLECLPQVRWTPPGRSFSCMFLWKHLLIVFYVRK